MVNLMAAAQAVERFMPPGYQTVGTPTSGISRDPVDARGAPRSW
jgi:hypothetical protein